MIQKLARESQIDGIQYLLQQMKLEGISCSEDLFVIVIDSYRQKGLVEQALKMFYRIKEFGCEPTVKIYNRVLDALLSENRLSMINPIYGCSPNIYTFSSLMKGYFKAGRVHEAFVCWNRMVREGIETNTVFYNTVIHGLCSNGKVNEALSLSYQMEENGWPPNVVSYSSLINGFAKVSDLVGASETWNVMMSNGCHPNVVAYTSMVDVLCRHCMFDCARSLIEKMVLENCTPSTVTFNAFIKGLCSNGRVDWAMKALDEMKHYGCVPNIITYNELLDGLFKVNRLKDAYVIVQEIEEKGIEWNLVTYNTIFSGFCHAGMLEDALQLLGKMLIRDNGIVIPCTVKMLAASDTAAAASLDFRLFISTCYSPGKIVLERASLFFTENISFHTRLDSPMVRSSSTDAWELLCGSGFFIFIWCYPT
ncbi:Desiccation-related protein PCC13-62 [Hibiscus syriacus]|uniref:Desiccation-related protein PCC13-62 n=1 Tax=Hibiscus syriacus TaxID=106335 RepID=A0A6A3APQ7_HIBSY|nr:Desiccation-related protein PCC13-62 [Hibiscus syriacus]